MKKKNRRLLTQTKFDYQQTIDFMQYRMSKLDFEVDEQNNSIFKLLCCYFADDPSFTIYANDLPVPVANPSLDKGLLIFGNFGVGKTWLMRLFAINPRQSFEVAHAQRIAQIFYASGEEQSEYYQPKINPINDKEKFYQRHLGLCIDDIGSESEKSHYGNKKNVIGDLIEYRYLKKTFGPLLHGTTNLTASQIESYYGGRVLSRMYEMFNFIVMPGVDRRRS